MKSVVIVGGGLFGSIIRDALHKDGHVVTVIDDARPMAGSAPAACLMKPSWFSGLGKEIYDPALELLDQLYGIEELQFRLGRGRVGGVKWVQPHKILQGMDLYGTVRKVKDDHVVFTEPVPNGLLTLKFDVCIVAAGVWSNALVDVPGLKGQTGVAFTWRTPECFEMEPFIKVWAPYRQLVAFMRDERELWVGDGTSIKSENWTDDRLNVSLHRCADALGLKIPPTRSIVGIRPQIRGVKHAHLKQMSPKVWVATGGAKNGTLGAAWCGHKLREALS